MSRVRGKKRMEIIKKFLEGEEDPDYEVIPTVTEGKYFVRPRKGSKSKNKSQNGLSEPLRDKVPKKKKEPKHQAVKQSHSNQSFQELYDPTISYQILEQLKLLGEEQRLKRTKKEQKKLVKHQIQKQLKRKEQQEPEQESSSSSEEYNYDVVEEEPKQIFKPPPLRRRVNLNK